MIEPLPFPGRIPTPQENGWIQTFTGRAFWPLAPQPEEVVIEDVAHALAHLCRYTGHTRTFFSVAQHSVLASHAVPAADALWALLHDASEAYLADVARPVKAFLPEYRVAEERLELCIARRFGLPWPMPASVREADRRLLATERRDLMTRPPAPWLATERVDPYPEVIAPWTPRVAEVQFLARFKELGGR